MDRRARHAVALCAATFAVLACATPALAVGSGTNGAIYYSVYDGGLASHIWAINPDGSNLHQITSEPGSQMNPSVSPDGLTVAYQQSGGAGQQVDTQPIAGGTATDVTGALFPGGSATDPSYCGDGSIAYLGDPTNDAVTDVYDTGTGQVTGTEYPGTGGHQQAEYVENAPACSSTNAIAFVRPTDATDPLPSVQDAGPVTAELWTAPEQKVTSYFGPTGQAVLSVLLAAWSPDGSQLAIIGRLNGIQDANEQVLTMHADGSDITQLGDVPGGGLPRGLTWSPDGTALAYVEAGGGIMVENVTSFTQQVLAVDSSGSVDWAPGAGVPQTATPATTSTPAAPPSSGPGSGSPPGGPSAPQIDAGAVSANAPLFTVIHTIAMALLAHAGLPIPVTVPGQATVTATLTVPISVLARTRAASAKQIVLGTATVQGSGTLELTVRLTRLAKAKLRMLGRPGHVRSVTATLTLTTVTLRRRWVTVKRLTIH